MKQLDNLFLYPSFFVWFSYSPINGKGSIPFSTNIKKYLIKEKDARSENLEGPEVMKRVYCTTPVEIGLHDLPKTPVNL